MEPDGVGALYQALAELRKTRKRRTFEGPKQQLPRYPKRIAVVTSPSGAVIRDIITTVKDGIRLHNWSFFQPWFKASRRRMTLCGTFSEPMRKAILIR